ncbi:conserved hypothetical protein [Microcystis aeruginosa PCC 9806]|uniref:Methyltransferase FkbM n=1 Tax=Microcystis aeruginosa PCC 9806 TaxID=1160282 RepID=I4GU03_MICAE|nr:hypothetical protein [Microcystis aeruginosa]CCI13277.1 conserved hypothetical protein [Microcystis aeruginosa PCC 9806]
MTDFQLTTPVAFLIFNRPDTTARVFEAIRQAKPPKLLVVADGPRPDRADDIEKCKAARAIIEGVDWDCEVLTNYSNLNLGCGKRPATGITWVFEQVEEAIIFEDDCLPDSTFFRFCQVMLDQYSLDERIMMITGTNWLGRWKDRSQSYHFSCHGGTWGWASWRRAWQYFDYDLKLWANSEIRDVLAGDKLFKYREQIYWKTYQNPDAVTWWDYQWGFSRLVQSGLSIVPSVNLISNIGFGENATHTKSPNAELANLNTSSLEFPLKINPFVAVDREYDKKMCDKLMKPQNLFRRSLQKLNCLLNP